MNLLDATSLRVDRFGTSPPGLLVLDEQDALWEGQPLWHILKLNRATNPIPTVVLVEPTSGVPNVAGIEIEADVYLPKPVESNRFHQAVEDCCVGLSRTRERGIVWQLKISLRSACEYLEQAVTLLRSMWFMKRFSADEARRFALAIQEMGMNAIEWGNRKRLEKLAWMTFVVDSEKVVAHIRDSGPGFDRQKLPHAADRDDPVRHMTIREEIGIREGGFGILMTQGLVDDLQYNDTGNEVRLTKRFSRTENDGTLFAVKESSTHFGL
ncbi:MAG: ATP-binding protein [Gemmataceae bacterium]